MKIKICGITNFQDAKIAVDLGADALGFVFYKKSPRYISPENVAEIISKLPPFVEKVGLFVNHSAEEIQKIFKLSNISLAQLHFEIDEVEKSKLTIPNIRVIRAKNKNDLNLFENEYRFVDAYVKEYGGMGKRLNLEWFQNRDNSKIILAGGLTPENLHELKGLNFFGVDVSSGVEEKPRIKSYKKIEQFIKLAKNL